MTADRRTSGSAEDTSHDRNTPRDRVPNPVIIIGHGKFGNLVLRLLEDQADSLAELFGVEVVRNFGTLRVLSEEELSESIDNGFRGATLLRRGHYFPRQPLPSQREVAYERNASMVVRGLDASSPANAWVGAQTTLTEQLREFIADLFDVEKFVDFHEDDSAFVSRLDVFVVGEAMDPVAGGLHCAVQEALAQLAAGPFSALFKAYRSNLALSHLLAFPVVREAESVDEARGIVARYRAELQNLTVPPVQARFLFLEDRSHKYVTSTEQMVSVFSNYVRLLTFGRAGNSYLLRDLVDPLPDAQRLRVKGYQLNHLCGAFSVAALETPLPAILRYARNRQAIAALNEFLGEAQDGEEPKSDEAVSLLAVEDWSRRFGEGGTLEERFDAQVSAFLTELNRQRLEVQQDRDLIDWKLGRYDEWGYHAELVEAFHDDLGGSATPKYTEGWLNEIQMRALNFLGTLVKNTFKRLFQDVERAGNRLVREFLDERRSEVDEMITSKPDGWKEAADFLDGIVTFLRQQRGRLLKELVEQRFIPISQRQGFASCQDILKSFTSEADSKPVKKRFLRHAWMLGAVGGMGVGCFLSPFVPIVVGGLAVPALLGAVAGAAAMDLLARRHNRRIYNSMLDLIASFSSYEPLGRVQRAVRRFLSMLPGRRRSTGEKAEGKDVAVSSSMKGRLTAACDELFAIDPAVSSFVGERLNWSMEVWKLRFYNRTISELEQDLKGLRDVGRVLSIQLDSFRADQEKLGVQYPQSGEIVGEEVAHVIPPAGVFHKPMLVSSSLEAIYAHWSETPDSAATRYMVDREPFKEWRVRLPFTNYRELADFYLITFLDLQEEDFLSFESTGPGAVARLEAFLGDFANKMEMHMDRGPVETGPGATEDKLAVFHPDLEEELRTCFSKLGWPQGWRQEDGLKAHNGLYLVRHAQGLAPWEAASLGSHADLIKELASRGELATVLELIRLCDSPALVTSMVAVALAVLAGLSPEEWSDREKEEQARRLLDLFLSGASTGRSKSLGERPVDGGRFAPSGEAREWLARFAGQKGILTLSCRLYGVGMETTEYPMDEAFRRFRLLSLSSGGDVERVRRELSDLPPDWREPLVESYVRAAVVLHLVFQQFYGKARTLLSTVTSRKLATARALEASVVALEKAGKVEALAFLNLVSVPKSAAPPIPREACPDFAELSTGCAPLRGHENLPVALALVYGGAEFAHLDEEDDRHRYAALMAATPEGGASALLRMFDRFPAGMIDPNLISRASEEAR